MINTSKIEEHFRNLMIEGLGLDLSDPNLIGTPKRVAKMYATFFAGMDNEFDGLTIFPNDEDYDQIVLMDNIFFVSMCSHHFLPFYGHAWVAYIPNQVVMGASKASRIINHYAARPQLQETLCEQVVTRLEKLLQPKALLILMRAEHGCMKCRGIKQYGGAAMMTSAVRGHFKDDGKARAEAMDMIKISMR